MELCLRMEEEPTGSLWVRIKERTGLGVGVVHVCVSAVGCLIMKNKFMRPSTDRSSLTFVGPGLPGGY